jgi:hypothetical protein
MVYHNCSTLSGQDSLLSIVQMPRGIPVGTLAIGDAGAANAAILAASILAAHVRSSPPPPPPLFTGEFQFEQSIMTFGYANGRGCGCGGCLQPEYADVAQALDHFRSKQTLAVAEEPTTTTTASSSSPAETPAAPAKLAAPKLAAQPGPAFLPPGTFDVPFIVHYSCVPCSLTPARHARHAQDRLSAWWAEASWRA